MGPVELAGLLGISVSEIGTMASILQDCVIGPGLTPLTVEQFNKLELRELLAPLRQGNGIKLVKYYPDTVDEQTGSNYSRMALGRATVHVSRPQLFNDPFDCMPGVEKEQVVIGFLRSIARYFGIELQVSSGSEVIADELVQAMNVLPEEKLPALSSLANPESLLIQTHYLGMLTSALVEGSFTQQGILDYARLQVDNFCNGVRNLRISCFTTNPFNLHMWSHYANEHRGFCVEYETDPSAIVAKGLPLAYYETLYQCIYSVYYHQQRPDNTAFAVDWLTKRLDFDGLRRLYARILCSKGFNWVFESECRLIVQDQNWSDDVPFFPIRKVYVGQYMSDDAKKRLLEMLVRRNIPVSEVIVPNSGYRLSDRPLCCVG